MKARRSNKCTSCSFFKSASWRGGIRFFASRSRNVSGETSSLSRSFGQSSSSHVVGFFFRPGV